MFKIRRFTILVLSALACLNLSCIQRSETSVTIYCATDREYADLILDSIERRLHRDKSDSIEIVRVYDVESSKTLGLVTRIEQEKAEPKCDVLWNNEILHTIRLQRAGLLAPHAWPIPDTWPKSFVASDSTWVGFATRARILLVNTENLKDREQWPESVTELSDPKWKQRCGLANPVYGTTATHFAVLASHPQALKNVAWDDWYQSVRQNAIVLAGNKQVALGVASGELDWGLTDTDDAVAEIAKGRPVAIVFPDQTEDGFGTLFIPNTAAIIKGTRNPSLATQVANYIASDRTEKRLALGDSAHFPIWPNVPDPENLKTTGVRRANVDFELAADRWETLRDSLTLPVAKEAPDGK
jgi:iron(III) transport system substrate-binding protein